MQDLTISIIQFDQCWENISENFQRIEKLLPQAQGSDLIVLPEMFHTGFSMNTNLAEEWMENKALHVLKEWSSRSNAAIYTSLMVREQNQFFNRGVFVQPSGMVSIYNKRKSFGLGGEDQMFTEGTTETIITFKGWKLNIQICYDLRFPELIRNRIEENGQAAYDVLLYVANWPKKRVLHWSTLLQARAIENQCYTIGVNRVGIDGNDIEYPGASAVYNGLGATILEMANHEAVLKCTLSWSEIEQLRNQLPFLKDRK
jgi:predicted amidohydrolase